MVKIFQLLVMQDLEKKAEWFCLALGNPTWSMFTPVEIRECKLDIESYEPICAFAGKDGNLYWSLKSVALLVGKKEKDFPRWFGLYGIDVLDPDCNSWFELECRILSTDQVYDMLKHYSETMGNLFHKALTQGRGSVTFDKGIYTPYLRTVPTLTLGDTCFTSWIENFIAKQLASRCNITENLPCQWFSLSLSHQYTPILALVGNDGELYWDLKRVRYFDPKRDIMGYNYKLPPDVGLRGKDVLGPNIGSKFDQECRLVSTKQLNEILQDKTLNSLFSKALKNGQGPITYSYGYRILEDSYTHERLDLLPTLTLGDTSIPEWIQKFTKDPTPLLREYEDYCKN